MAINPLPQGLHNQFTEVLDSSPIMRRNLELQARQQAKEDALNQYFNDLPSKINTAGVRTQDLDNDFGGINKDIQAWRDNWMKNAEAIKRGGAAQQQHMQGFQEILRRIEQSKNRAKTELEIGKLKLEGKYNPDDDDLNIIGTIGKSIYDPSSYKKDGVSEYGIGDLSPAIPEFDVDRQKKYWENVTKGMQAGKVYDYEKKRTDKTTGQAIVPYQKIYSKEQIGAIAKNAANSVQDDKSARKYYNRILNDPKSTRWQELNKAYQSVFGDKEMVSTVEQAAAADAIIRAATPVEVGEEQELNRQQAQEYKIYNMMYNRGSGGGGVDESNEFDRIPFELKNLPNKNGVIYNKDLTSPFTGEWGIKGVNLPAQTRAILKSGGIEIKENTPYWLDIEEGNVWMIKDKNGNKVADRDDMFNAQIKWNEKNKRFGKERNLNNPSTPNPKPTKDNKTFVFPNGKTTF